MQGNYNFYIMQNGKPEKIEYSSNLKIKLSKKEKENLRRMRKHRNGSISLEIYDPYKDFKAKIKEQIINKEIKENDSAGRKDSKRIYFRKNGDKQNKLKFN